MIDDQWPWFFIIILLLLEGGPHFSTKRVISTSHQTGSHLVCLSTCKKNGVILTYQILGRTARQRNPNSKPNDQLKKTYWEHKLKESSGESDDMLDLHNGRILSPFPRAWGWPTTSVGLPTTSRWCISWRNVWVQLGTHRIVHWTLWRKRVVVVVGARRCIHMLPNAIQCIHRNLAAFKTHYWGFHVYSWEIISAPSVAEKLDCKNVSNGCIGYGAEVRSLLCDLIRVSDVSQLNFLR